MIPFFGVLFKGRKSEGPNNEQRPIAITPNGAARVELSTATSPVFPGATPPADISGESLWLNTNAGYEGLYFYDLTRGKWLETALQKFSFGEDIADNKILSPAGITNAGTDTGYLVPQGITIVGVAAHARTGNPTKPFQVRTNAAAVLTSFSLTAFDFEDMDLNVDLAGGIPTFVDVFATNTGASSTDVTIEIYYRRSGS